MLLAALNYFDRFRLPDFQRLLFMAYFLVQVKSKVDAHPFWLAQSLDPAKAEGRLWDGIQTHLCHPGSWLGYSSVWFYVVEIFVRNVGAGIPFSSSVSRTPVCVGTWGAVAWSPGLRLVHLVNAGEAAPSLRPRG